VLVVMLVIVVAHRPSGCHASLILVSDHECCDAPSSVMSH
jgi:hypothetical protein